MLLSIYFTLTTTNKDHCDSLIAKSSVSRLNIFWIINKISTQFSDTYATVTDINIILSWCIIAKVKQSVFLCDNHFERGRSASIAGLFGARVRRKLRPQILAICFFGLRSPLPPSLQYTAQLFAKESIKALTFRCFNVTYWLHISCLFL